MISVEAERDRVILDLHGRRRDSLLTVAQAYLFADALEEAAGLAGMESPSAIRSQVWGVRCDSYDGYVALRFTPPSSGNPTRVPLPADVALKLAVMVRRAAGWAKYKAKLVVNGAG